MHELVGLGHSVTRAVVGSYHGETRTSEHTGISLAEEGWTVANDNETLVAALTCTSTQGDAQPELFLVFSVCGVLGRLHSELWLARQCLKQVVMRGHLKRVGSSQHTT
jgi:hypothetical protein